MNKYCLLIFCLLLAPISHAQVLIVNPDNIDTDLSLNTVRSIFAMRTHQWSDGSPIHVFVLEDNDNLHSDFCKEILKVFPYQLRRLWDKQIFSGTGVAPTTVKSIEEMRERVANTKGAIGYIRKEQLTDTIKQIGMPL
ncbi:MAG: hypothetical protein IME94_05650 [Proteobacteria bacterium]|nr:hypothetical protein [Pseudomonadota bacterium]